MYVLFVLRIVPIVNIHLIVINELRGFRDNRLTGYHFNRLQTIK